MLGWILKIILYKEINNKLKLCFNISGRHPDETGLPTRWLTTVGRGFLPHPDSHPDPEGHVVPDRGTDAWVGSLHVYQTLPAQREPEVCVAT